MFRDVERDYLPLPYVFSFLPFREADSLLLFKTTHPPLFSLLTFVNSSLIIIVLISCETTVRNLPSQDQNEETLTVPFFGPVNDFILSCLLGESG